MKKSSPDEVGVKRQVGGRQEKEGILDRDNSVSKSGEE